MNLPIEFLLALSLLGQQVSENLLGTLISGTLMRLAAIGVCIGLAFGAGQLGFDALAGYTTLQTIVLGAFAGLGSNVLHGFLVRFAPGANSAPLLGFLGTLSIRSSPPPASGPPK